MTDLTPRNRDYSLFLPSLSSVYSKYCSGYYSIKNTPRQDVHPKGVPSFECLNFFTNDDSFFQYKKILFSAGHAFLNLELAKKNESMIHERDRSKTFVLADSGGYQIGKGIIKFDWKDFEGNAANKVRQKILDYLEFSSDYAMVLDIPPWAAFDDNVPGIDNFEDCLKGTLFNNDFFVRNRQGKTKFLNVIQGQSLEHSKIWFDAVKDYPFEGWAFAGDHMRDFSMMLQRIIEMRDEHYFEENSNGHKRDWLHFLGQSKLNVACAFTSIQNLLRKELNNPNFTVSFDSASAFISTANGHVFTRDVFSKKQFSYLMEEMYDDHDLVGSDLPIPWRSSISDHLTIGDICVKDREWRNRGDKIPKTSWDSYSYVLLMCHNLERQIKAIQQANQIYALPHSTGKFYMPPELIEFKEVVEDIFENENPMDLIKRNSKLLNNFSGRKTGKGVPVLQGKISEMFEMQGSTAQIEGEIDYEDQDEANFIEDQADSEQ